MVQVRRRASSPLRAALFVAATVAATVSHAAPLVQLATFQDSPDPVASTQQLTYQLRVNNVSPTLPADGVTLNVPVPVGATFVSVSDPSCNYFAPNVFCTFGTMAADTNRIVDIVLQVTASGGATLTSTAVAHSSTGGETDTQIIQTTSVSSGADLQLNVSGAPDPVTAGGNVTYTLVSSNLGPDTAAALHIVNTLPPNVVYVSGTGAGWSCSAAGSTVTCDHPGSLANGANTTLNIVGNVQSSGSGNITDSATLSANVADGVLGNNTDTATVAVSTGADLNITKSALPAPMIAGNAATFILEPRNAGPDPANTITVTDTLPNGFTNIVPSGTGWSCSVNLQTVTCTRATMTVSSADNITISTTAPDNTFVPPAGMNSSNTASISAVSADANLGNNSSTANFSLQRDGSDLSISKTKSPNPVAQGAPLTSRLRATNNGPRALTGADTITITDTLPAGEDYTGAASFSDNGWDCNFAAPTFTCTRLGPLAVGAQTALLTLVTTANSPGTLTNQGCVAISGAQVDPNNTNNCTGAGSGSTSARADLVIVKSQDLATVTTADNVLTYTLTISNNGPQDSTNVVVTDVIPMRSTDAGGTVINAIAGTGDKGSTGSCSVVNAVVTCNYANLRYENVAPANTAETAVITITVTRPMGDGAFTNIADINSTTIGDPDRSNNTSQVNTTVDPMADVELQAKSVTPSSVRAGVDTTYVISFINHGPSIAQNVTVTDEFFPAPGDAGYTIQSITPSKGTCDPNAGPDLISCAIGSMNANEVQTITIVARPTWMLTPPSPRTLPNTATITTSTVDSNASNNDEDAVLTVTDARVDLIANIADVESFAGVNPDPLGFDGITVSNNVITYRMRVTNLGPSEATGVTVQSIYAVPVGQSATFLCDSSDQYSCTGGSICSAGGNNPVTANCAVGDLQANQTYTRYLRYTIDSNPPPSGDSYTNTVTVDANENDSNNGNNVAAEPTAVRAKADVTVTSKTAIISSPPLQYGQTFDWQIVVTNNGPGDAYSTVLADTLPTNMELILPLAYSVSSGGGICSNTGLTQLSCALGTITPSNSVTVTFSVVIRKPSSGGVPTSYNNSASVSTFSVDLVSNNNSNSGSVNLVKSSIAGTVYTDDDNDGVIDGTEIGIAGFTLTLTGHDVFGNVVNRNVVSGANGTYLFDNLEQADASGYTITQTQLATYSDGLETVGTGTGTPPGGTVSPTVGSQTISAILLDKDQIATGYNFGELRFNSIGGTVFADINNNGLKVASEPGIQGVSIKLLGTDIRGAAVDRDVSTSASGTYSFTNVLPGTYELIETQPVAYADGIDRRGNLLGDDTSINDHISGIPIAHTDGTVYTFGEQPGSISGRVFHDLNRDGAFDVGEPGLVTVRINLVDDNNAGFTRQVDTIAGGDYVFPDLPAGTYTLTQVQPLGYGSSSPANNIIGAITIAANGDSAGHNFGEVSGALSGKVFFDRDNDGVVDVSDTPLNNVELRLAGTNAAGGAVNLTVFTNASGDFIFTNLLAPNASRYTLTQIQPTAYVTGLITAGTAGGTPNQSGNTVTAITFAGGTLATDYLFAELGTPIGGVVYRDANRDSVKQVGEVGLSGVSLELRDAGNAVIATTTTIANGTYSFPPQAGGSYTVIETQPAGYESGPENASNSVAFALVANTPAVINFGESAGSLGGIVFLDIDNDGIQDVGESGLPGVALALSGTDANGAVTGNVVTDASGAYKFDNLLAGTYSITESQPAGLGDGSEVLGSGNVGGTIGNDIYSAITLPAGTQAAGYNFAETGAAVVGTVYRDFNRDGTAQAGDSGIANVTLTLEDTSHSPIATTTTAVDGSYMFAGITAGDYFVVETQPTGYGSAVTSPNSVAITAPVAGVVTVHFADTLSTLAGAVYIDLDNDGVRDAGEPGINGVGITLTGIDAGGAAVNRNATSDASGNYIFIDLLTPNGAGYTVSEPTQPSAYADGSDAAGTSSGTLGNDVVSSIALAVNTDATGYTFGELGTTLSGVVFNDINGNGTRDGGDNGLPNVSLTLRDSLNALVATTTTDASGNYAFYGLAAGNYTVVETQPAGYGSSSPDSVSVTLPLGGSATANFAEITSSIAGQVFADTNNDGQRQAGEPAIAGVTVTLSGVDAAGAAVNRAAISDANGDYNFAGVLSGTYTLTETQPAAYADGIDVAGSVGGTPNGADSITNITLPPGTGATGYLFGELGQSITGRAWLDSNRNGVLDSNEQGITAVTIELRDGANALIATTVTAADGSYNFTSVPAGNYSIIEQQPAGYGSSTPDTVAIVLTAGGVTPIVNFGDTAGSIAGFVYTDANNNGTREAGEPGIPGVTLSIAGTDARGYPINTTLVSGNDGYYRFTDLVGGTYTITETQPADYIDGTNSAGTSGGTVGVNVISAISLGAAVDATGYLFAERGTAGTISGSVWRDANHDRVRDSNEGLLSNWTVELYQGALLVQTTTSDANGHYQFDGVVPGSGYEIRFHEPGNHALYGMPVTNERGMTAAPGTVGPDNPGGADTRGGTLRNLTLTPAGSIAEQSLPVDPMGVVYDSVSRLPIPGATATLTGPAGFDASTHLLGGPTNLQQVTNVDGFYQFLLLSTAPAGTYTVQVTPPPGRYMPGESALIPSCTGPLLVGAIPDPALVQGSSTAPAPSVPNVDGNCPTDSSGLAATANTTQYFLSFAFTPGASANLINNHIPVDPILGGALTISKTTPMVNVTRGDLVPYTITVTNTLNAQITNVDVRDLLPPGFAYRTGSAVVDGVMLEPQRSGRQLTWVDQTFAANERRIYKLVLIVGAGVSEGEYVNQAFALNNLIGANISNVATAAVRVVPDPLFDCSDIIGKVFDDKNVNGYQDKGEAGIANVRLATTNGVLVTTDADGRFHVACAAVPNEYRGSNFVMKLDERTLPSGYRITTENPRVVRLTRGKMTKLNFGVAIHRVVRIEVSDAAFEADSVNLKPEWLIRVGELPQTLRDQPSVVRIAYVPGSADQKLVKRRKQELIKQVRMQWEALHCCYPLQVEEVTEGQP